MVAPAAAGRPTSRSNAPAPDLCSRPSAPTLPAHVRPRRGRWGAARPAVAAQLHRRRRRCSARPPCCAPPGRPPDGSSRSSPAAPATARVGCRQRRRPRAPARRVLGVAIVGPDSNAANIAPVSVLVVWWVGPPDRVPARSATSCAGSARSRPRSRIVPHGRATEGDGTAAPRLDVRRLPRRLQLVLPRLPPPRFAQRPGRVPRRLPRWRSSLGALRWGRAWVVTGEGFGGLSAAVARIGLRRPRGRRPGGHGRADGGLARRHRVRRLLAARPSGSTSSAPAPGGRARCSTPSA